MTLNKNVFWTLVCTSVYFIPALIWLDTRYYELYRKTSNGRVEESKQIAAISYRWFFGATKNIAVCTEPTALTKIAPSWYGCHAVPFLQPVLPFIACAWLYSWYNNSVVSKPSLTPNAQGKKVYQIHLSDNVTVNFEREGLFGHGIKLGNLSNDSGAIYELKITKVSDYNKVWFAFFGAALAVFIVKLILIIMEIMSKGKPDNDGDEKLTVKSAPKSYTMGVTNEDNQDKA